MFRQNGLGMELHTIGGVFAVFERHDLTFDGGGDDFQLGRDRFVDHQRVIAHGFEGRRDAIEDAVPVMDDAGGLAVHQARSAAHLAAEDRAQALMAQADSQHRDFAVEVFDRLGGDAVILDGFAGAGGDDQVIRFEGDQFVERDLVIAEDFDVCAQFAEVLDEVVGK